MKSDKTGCHICKHAKTENLHGRQEVRCCLDDMLVMRPSKGCNYCEKKALSNADRIRQMTDEELSAFLGGIADNCSYNTCDNCPMYGACVDVPLSRDKWLKQEVSEDAGTD